MADRKITELSAMSAGGQATGDLVTIVDVSEAAAADKNKKMTMENLFKGIPGNVGIGTSAPQQFLHVHGANGRMQITSTGTGSASGDGALFGYDGSEDLFINNRESTNFKIFNAGSERMRIDSDGSVLIGATSDFGSGSGGDLFQVASSSGGHVLLGRDASTVTAGQNMGMIRAYSNGGSTYGESSRIQFSADASHTSSNKAGRITFFTSSTSALTERMRIDSSGRLLRGTTSTSANANTVLQGSSGGTTGAGRLFLQRGSTPVSGQALADLIFADNGSGIGGFISVAREGGTWTSGSSHPSRMSFATTSDGASSATERMRIDSSGNSIQYSTGTLNRQHRQQSSSVYTATNIRSVISGAAGYLAFDTNTNWTNGNAVERMRLDSSGRLLVGTSTALSSGNSQYAKIQTLGNTAGATGNARIVIGRGQAATSMSSGNSIGEINFTDNTSAEFAQIQAFVDGTPGSNDYPGRLVFSTTADGESSPTERMRIKNNGDVSCGAAAHLDGFSISSSSATGSRFASSGTAVHFASGTSALVLSRQTNDGAIVSLRQAGSEEGSITVSGSTVSYNGGHLSRWSQLTDGAERTEILRGSVLSNLDEMCEWGEEDNEQLNRMKVSDVEGDVNVSGVFQAWDDDDDTYLNDFYCAMTGDFVIRIAQGTTVARGDLLMSAGDGTAKPQDDDIVRSKTIAKVTSTTVSTTYADGSYCVPCVLMAC